MAALRQVIDRRSSGVRITPDMESGGTDAKLQVPTASTSACQSMPSMPGSIPGAGC